MSRDDLESLESMESFSLRLYGSCALVRVLERVTLESESVRGGDCQIWKMIRYRSRDD